MDWLDEVAYEQAYSPSASNQKEREYAKKNPEPKVSPVVTKAVNVEKVTVVEETKEPEMRHRCMDHHHHIHTEKYLDAIDRSPSKSVDVRVAKHTFIDIKRRALPILGPSDLTPMKSRMALPGTNPMDKKELDFMISFTSATSFSKVLKDFEFGLHSSHASNEGKRAIMSATVSNSQGPKKYMFEEEKTFKAQFETSEECKTVYVTRYVPVVTRYNGVVDYKFMETKDLFINTANGKLDVPFQLSLSTNLPDKVGFLKFKEMFSFESASSIPQNLSESKFAFRYAPLEFKNESDDKNAMMDAFKNLDWVKQRSKNKLSAPDMENYLVMCFGKKSIPDGNNSAVEILGAIYLVTTVSICEVKEGDSSMDNTVKRVNSHYKEKTRAAKLKEVTQEQIDEDAKAFDDQYGGVIDEEELKSTAAFMDIFKKPPASLLYSPKKFSSAIDIKIRGGVESAARLKVYFDTMIENDGQSGEDKLEKLGFAAYPMKLVKGAMSLSNSGFTGKVKRIFSTFVPEVKDMDYTVWVSPGEGSDAWSVLQFPLTKFKLKFQKLFKDKRIDRDHARGFIFTFENKGETKQSVDRRVRLKMMFDEKEGDGKFFFGTLERKEGKKEINDLSNISMVVLEKDLGMSSDGLLKNLYIFLKQSAFDFIQK